MVFRGKVSFVTKNGSLFARAVYRHPLTNIKKQMWRKVTGKQSDAKALVIKDIEAILEQKEEEILTFLDLAKYYKEKHAVPARFIDDTKVAGQKAWKGAHHDIKMMSEFFGEIPLRKLNRDKIQAFRLHRLDQKVRKIDRKTGKEFYQERSLASVNHHLRTLRAMLNVALENDWIDKLPNFKGLISASSENKREIIPTEEEFERLLQATQKRARLNHVKPIILTIADTGARPIELWNLLWTDVDFERNRITLTSDKGKKRLKREIGLTVRVKEELEALPRINEYVFGGLRSIRTAWHSIQKEADCYHLDIYHLRHLFASRLNEIDGASELTKMKLMGQTQLLTFDRYVKITDETIETIIKELDRNPYLPIQKSEVLQ